MTAWKPMATVPKDRAVLLRRFNGKIIAAEMMFPAEGDESVEEWSALGPDYTFVDPIDWGEWAEIPE